MTSAARPTWSAALSSGGGLRDGSSSAPTLQTCSKDQPGHLKLKLRQTGQDTSEELATRNFRNECSNSSTSFKKLTSSLILGDSDTEIDSIEPDDNDCNSFKNSLPEDKKNIDEEFNSSDDENEEAELLKELEKIRRERETEKLANEKKSVLKDPHSILACNPLLVESDDTGSSFGAKRRWDDDVVFKNQSKGVDEKPQKRFINDTTRSDFHRRFMDKFIK